MATVKPAVGESYPTIQDAKTAILEWIVDNGQSFKVSKATRGFWVAVCRDPQCSFRVRIAQRDESAYITKFEDYNCPYSTHQNFRQARSVALLSSRHRVAVVDNREITPA